MDTQSLGMLDQLTKALSEELGHGGEQKNNMGVITSYKDGVIAIKGLANLRMNEVVEVESVGIKALVLNLDQQEALAIVLEHSTDIKEGLFVKSLGQTLSVDVNDAILGRIVSPLGAPMDGEAALDNPKQMPIEKIAPGVVARKSVDEPVQTGILAIDSMIPIGRGQRELIIGDRQTGKTSIALDTIINQKGQDMICVYVSIGQREAKLASVYAQLKAKGAMDYTVIVNAPASSNAVMQYLAPFAGAAIGEYFMDQGKDVLVVFDDLTKHAVAYREMSLLLRRPPGREAYPGDVFYLHSRLLERAARLNENYGGGSITALPIIETQAGDVSAYIPTNVISITDGQIFLETSLFNKGIRPAINIGISVSRVGGSAQTKVMKKVAGPAKLNLTQYYELEAFSQFASDLDAGTLAQLTRGRRVVEAMKQKQGSPYSLWQEVTLLLAATEGHLDATPVEECRDKLQQLLDHMQASESELIALIEGKKEYSDEVKAGLKRVLDSFFHS